MRWLRTCFVVVVRNILLGMNSKFQNQITQYELHKHRLTYMNYTSYSLDYTLIENVTVANIVHLLLLMMLYGAISARLLDKILCVF